MGTNSCPNLTSKIPVTLAEVLWGHFPSIHWPGLRLNKWHASLGTNTSWKLKQVSGLQVLKISLYITEFAWVTKSICSSIVCSQQRYGPWVSAVSSYSSCVWSLMKFDHGVELFLSNPAVIQLTSWRIRIDHPGNFRPPALTADVILMHRHLILFKFYRGNCFHRSHLQM